MRKRQPLQAGQFQARIPTEVTRLPRSPEHRETEERCGRALRPFTGWRRAFSNICGTLLADLPEATTIVICAAARRLICCRSGAGRQWRGRRSRRASRRRLLPRRERGMNRYEVHAALRERRDTVPSPSTIYRVFKRNQLNRRTPAMREGETSHYQGQDRRARPCRPHQLSPRHVPGASAKYRLHRQSGRQLFPLGLGRGPDLEKGPTGHVQDTEDDHTLNVTYGIQFAEILSDNGAKFASRSSPEKHPSRPCRSARDQASLHHALPSHRPTARSYASGEPWTMASSRVQPSTTSTTSPTSSSNTSSTTTTSGPIRPSAAGHPGSLPPVRPKPLDQRIDELFALC